MFTGKRSVNIRIHSRLILLYFFLNGAVYLLTCLIFTGKFNSPSSS
jgi:hypothetical protein